MSKIFVVYDRIHNVNIAVFLKEENAVAYVEDTGHSPYYEVRPVALLERQEAKECVYLVLQNDDNCVVIAAFFEYEKAKEFADKETTRYKHFYIEGLVVEDSITSAKSMADVMGDWGYHSDGEYL